LVEETAALNVSTERLKTVSCGSLFQSDIVRGKQRFLSLSSLTMSDNERQEIHVLWLAEWWLKAVFFWTRYIFSFSILYIMTSRASMHLSLRLRQFKCCNMSPALDVFRCLLVASLSVLYWTSSSWSISHLLWGFQAEQAYWIFQKTRKLNNCSYCLY
jgi:hypothetical protein